MAANDQSVSPAVEDYAKAIYSLETRGGDRPVRTTELAKRLGVTPASASGMVKKLAELSLVRYVPYRGVQLTERGLAVALEVLRHHRLLETYLAESLGVAWDRVHDEAEVLEHVLSEQLEEQIAIALGSPTRDPHGDPIPHADGRIEERPTEALYSFAAGIRGIFVRVSDTDPEILRYLAALGISPGSSFEIVEKQPFDGPLFVRFGDAVHVLGPTLARAIRVEVSA